MSAIVQTVLGPLSPTKLGRTLTHEHLFIDYRKFVTPAPQKIQKYVEGDLTLQNIGFVQRYPYSNVKNVCLDNEDAALYDVSVFKEFEGGTIVENTSHGLGRRADLLHQVSKATGVNIVAGTGFYLASVQNEANLSLTTEQMYDVMMQDLSVGCFEAAEVRCGFIGEVASDYPIHPFEGRAIQATGQLQGQLKCPVSYHPGRDTRAPSDIMRLHAEAGGITVKTVMSHLDRTLTEQSDLLDFAKEFGCFLQLDLFGTEVLTYQFSPDTQMPSDRQRIDVVKSLLEEGLQDRILLSHDVHTKQRLLHYGGHGYMHLFGNVLPKMRHMNISEDYINHMTIDNPSRWLQWVP